jgi:hypothetical protein|tara:strand:+ start:1824 stop:2024 length:201 start_codon:yes stop_codon:yes gene_type:complete
MNALNSITEKLFRDNLNLPLILRQIEKTEVNLEDYPWDECIAEQTKKYGEDAAPKICGYIKEKYGN